MKGDRADKREMRHKRIRRKILSVHYRPSGGIDRSVLAFLVDAYFEEKVKDERAWF
jgi:glycyl-tRNA synthetase (class II)